MSEFTRAIFAAKELFGPEEMKQFSVLGGARERLHFVDRVVPEELTRISVVRELEEQEELEEDEEQEEEVVSQKGPRLFSPHPRFPCLSDAVRVEYTSDRGRHVSAARRLKRGEVVAIEAPIVMFPVTRDWSSHCSCCLLPLPPCPLACPSCRTASYCSTSCRRAARHTHRWECSLGLLELLQQAHPGLGKLLMVLRVFTQRRARWFLEEGPGLREHRPQWGAGPTDRLATDYSTLFNLARHGPSEPPALLEVALVALVMVRMLRAVGYFSGQQAGEQEDMVGELATVLVSVVNVNTHPVHDMASEQGKTLCAAVYPVVAALFNHSCDPSLVRASWGSRVVLAAGREVEEGEELTDMYTVHWTEYTVQERRDYLHRVFHFTCDCQACREGWQPQGEETEWRPDIGARLAQHYLRAPTEERLIKLLRAESACVGI